MMPRNHSTKSAKLNEMLKYITRQEIVTPRIEMNMRLISLLESSCVLYGTAAMITYYRICVVYYIYYIVYYNACLKMCWSYCLVTI